MAPLPILAQTLIREIPMVVLLGRPLLCRLLFLALSLAASSAMGLSVGEITVHSRLGEPLHASVALGRLGGLSEADVHVRRASEEIQRADGKDPDDATRPLRFSLQVDRNGVARVDVTTDRPVGEPYLDFVLEVRWPQGRSVRRFTVLLDPPAR